MSDALVYTVGFTAQILFSARILVQWIASERAHKILSPVLFWQLSMLASFLLCVYGWLRNDFAIITGQMIAYYIYIWNLNMKGAWKPMPLLLRAVFVATPVISVIYCCCNWEYTLDHLFKQENIPTWLILFGLVGQFVFTFRFIYQWIYSRRKGESLLPVTFWIISLTGSALIVTYAAIRVDYVYILGQSAGLIAYTRNIMIGLKDKKKRGNPDTDTL